MIVRLTKEEQRQERRKLLQGNVDVVYAICHDALKELNPQYTNLSAVEIYLSAKEWVKMLVSLGDIDEALEDEMDDLYDEAREAENGTEHDGMIIMIVASAIICAESRKRVGLDAKKTIMSIFSRWDDHELLLPLLSRFSEKEQARWSEGKRTNLLTYELECIDNSKGSQDIHEFLEWFAYISDTLDQESVRGLILAISKYNMDHGYAYTKEIDALYKKLGIKGTPIVQGDFVLKKEVQNEVNGVQSGGTGVSIKTDNHE